MENQVTTEEEAAAKLETERQDKLLRDAEDVVDLEGIANLGTVKTDDGAKKDDFTGDNIVDDVEAKAKTDADAQAKADAEAKAKADADAKVKEEADAKAKADADAKAVEDAKQQKPAGVFLKDGKTIVPYETLAATRRREDEERKGREAAERRSAEFEKQAREATEELERIRKDGGAAPKSQADLDTLKERVSALGDVPEVKEVFEALMDKVGSMQETIDSLKGAREDDDARRVEASRARVQEEIDRNPTLRYWQNEKPELFNEAVNFDKAMRESDNPEVANMPFASRFAKSVEMVENLHGKTQLPAEYQDRQQQDAEAKAKADADAKAKADADAKAKADAAVKSKDAKAGTEVKDRPLTLSDLPGGSAPTDGQKAVSEMTTGDMESAVNRMLDSGKTVEDIMNAYR